MPGPATFDSSPDAGAAAERPEIVIRPPAWSAGSVVRGLAALGGHWDLLYTLTLHRVRVRYKQSLLGVAWAVLQPLGTMVVLTVVFSYVARVPTGLVPYAVFALAGLVPWTCFSNALTTATQSLVGHAQLVTRVYFPREILPLTYVCAAVIDCAIAALVLGALMAWYGVRPAPSAIFCLPIGALLVALVTAIALLAAATQVRHRDVGVALPIVLQLLMFASPVAYPLEVVPAWARPYYVLNPLAGLIENFRRAVLGTHPLDPGSLSIAALWTVVLLPLAYAQFKRLEATAADHV